MELTAKAACAGLVAAVCALLVKKRAPELSLMLCCACAAAICAAGLTVLEPLWELWQSMAEGAGLSPAVMVPVAKCVGLGLITRLSAELCRDAGSASVAAAVELLGCVCALLAASPLMSMLLDTIGGLI